MKRGSYNLEQFGTSEKGISEEPTLHRKIDFVLAYEDDQDKMKKGRRRQFEKNLEDAGLILEYEDKMKSINKKTYFIKLHARWDVLVKYAEITNMKMPFKINDIHEDLTGCLEKCYSCLPSPFELSKKTKQDEPNYFTAPFNRNRITQFIIKDQETFFTNAQRSKIVYEILARTSFESERKGHKSIGISHMVSNGSYTAAFPLHDGRSCSEHTSMASDKHNDRRLLYEIWARPGIWYKYQPLDRIRSYFGEKIAIYFAWLGYYTSMLIPAAILGLAVFIYGWTSCMSDKPSNEICDENGVGNFTMCPLCDGRCTYWKLSDSCRYSKAAYLFDNYGTVIFAIIMTLWATFFQEFWKRKQAEMEYEWDVKDFETEEETVRPQFEAAVSRRRTNPVTKMDEPFVPCFFKLIRYGTTLTVMLLFLCVVIGAVVSIIVYRVVISAVLYSSGETDVKSRAPLIASATAACINFILIQLLNSVCEKIARFLTNLEQHRTQTEWEDALTFKMFLFQFINYYSTIIYITFFKGRTINQILDETTEHRRITVTVYVRLVGRPGKYYYNLLGTRPEECGPAGCLIEVCIQLGIVMIGKQALGNFKEIIVPKVIVWCKSRHAKDMERRGEDEYTRWEQDLNLADQPNMGLFDEYLEMVIQYGFVTLFVAAFPLAPLFALINNIIEIRLDAYKFVTQWKRPIAARAQNIGIWFGILRGISTIAVVTNAAIIAFTAEFIPKIVYLYAHSGNYTLDGYVNFTLSIFDVSDFQNQSIPETVPQDLGLVTECRYRGFNEPPGSPYKYQYSMVYWEVLAARLAFIVLFEHFLVFLTWLIMYLVPDIPYKVKIQMLREKFLCKEAFFESV